MYIYRFLVPLFIVFFTSLFIAPSIICTFYRFIICKYTIQPSGCNVLIIKLSIYLCMLLTLHMNKANCNKKRPQMFVLYVENNVHVILHLITVSFDSADAYCF